MPPEQKVVSSNLTGRTNFIFSNQHLSCTNLSSCSKTKNVSKLYQNPIRTRTGEGERTRTTQGSRPGTVDVNAKRITHGLDVALQKVDCRQDGIDENEHFLAFGDDRRIDSGSRQAVEFVSLDASAGGT